MASAFTLFGEIKADTGAFERSLKEADSRLKVAQFSISKTEQASKALGDTSATVARRYEKLNETVHANAERLNEAVSAYVKGEIGLKKYVAVLASVERQTTSLTSRIKDANARISEIGTTGATHFQNQIKGATSEISNLAAIVTGTRLSGVTSQFTSLGGAISAIPGPAGLAAGAIGLLTVGTLGLGAAFVSAGESAFTFLKSASEFGSKIKDVQDRTGLAAETLTSLKYAGEQGGVAFDTIAPAIAKFAKVVGDAAKGSDQANQKLTALGVNPVKALNDLDGALGDVFQRISELPTPLAKAIALQDAFGKGGAQLLPIFDEVGGSLSNYIEKQKELGTTLSQADLEAADNFGDTLLRLSTQAKTLGVVFATALEPLVTDAMASISQSLADNKDVIKSWGETSSNFVVGLIQKWTDLKNKIKEYKDAAEAALGHVETKGPNLANPYGDSRFDLITPILKAGAEINKTRARGTAGLKADKTGDLDETIQNYLDAFKKLDDPAKQVKEKVKDLAKEAEKFAEHVKTARTAILDIAISTSDNPYEKIFDNARKAAEKLREVTKGLNIDISAPLAQINAQAQNQAFKQRTDDRLQAFNYRDLARQFRAGRLDENTPENFQKNLQNKLAALGIGDQSQSVYGKGVNAPWLNWIGQPLAAKSKTLSDAQQHILDQQILQLAGNDPSKLNANQQKIVADAADREAKKLEDRAKAETKRDALLEENNKQLTTLNENGGLKLVIENNAPDNAKISTRPGGTATTKYYSKAN